MSQQVIHVTDAAREKAVWFRSRDPEPEALALWLEVTGVEAGEYTYGMYLDRVEKAPGDAVVQHHDDLPVVIPADSVEPLSGATLDRRGDLESGGIFIENPNKPSPVAGMTLPEGSTAEGDLADHIRQLLEGHINPQIASHGGRADLASVDEERGVVYVQLSGGCQGCGMASVTLKQGIEQSLKQVLPQITSVEDVTDHASGTNPYYQPAKK